MKIAGITQKGLVALSLAGAAMASVHANELYVEPTGVGIGVATPDRLLHLRGPNAVFSHGPSCGYGGFHHCAYRFELQPHEGLRGGCECFGAGKRGIHDQRSRCIHKWCFGEKDDHYFRWGNTFYRRGACARFCANQFH